MITYLPDCVPWSDTCALEIVESLELDLPATKIVTMISFYPRSMATCRRPLKRALLSSNNKPYPKPHQVSEVNNLKFDGKM
jgi:hypothetical protein